MQDFNNAKSDHLLVFFPLLNQGFVVCIFFSIHCRVLMRFAWAEKKHCNEPLMVWGPLSVLTASTFP